MNLATTMNNKEVLVDRSIKPRKNIPVSIMRDFLRPIASFRKPAKQAERRCPRTQLLA
jgi:hypothetical protein